MINTSSDQSAVYKYLIQLDALYHLRTDQALIPFLAAGGGVVSFDPHYRITGTDIFLDYGIGAKYFLKDNLAISGDIRHLLLFHDSDHDRNDFEYTIGLTWYWNGQRLPHKPVDSDQDGVPDDQDRCPETPLGTDVDAHGCPVLDASSLDSDGDGVTDDKDICPGTPVGKTVDAHGCILEIVPIPKDEVVETPPVVPVEEDIPVPEEIPAPAPKIAKVLEQPHPIQFDFDSAAIRPANEEAIRSLAEFLNKNPDLNAVIEGHADSIGTEEYNLVLSQRRADRVMKHLIALGTDSVRLTALGYGEDRLIADNSTDENRQMNRRVQVILSDRKGMP
jgi:OOP family OmpA-OmpF porin